ncbi:MAG: di-heme oxidoredictase family protein [Cyanobacteria bacterium P01_F01_bin.150]
MKIFTVLCRRWPRFIGLAFIPIVLGIALSIGLNKESPTQAIPLAGGTTTVFNRTSSAFEQPSEGLTLEEDKRHAESDAVFEAVFVTAPADINPGLGPLFNNASCVGCHIRNGRGLPTKGQLLVRVSEDETRAKSQLKPEEATGKTLSPDDIAYLAHTPLVSGLGNQLQDQGIYGQAPEAAVTIGWQEQAGQYADGEPYSLRSPHLTITLADGSPLPDTIKTSPRMPPVVFGLGLLEAIPEEELMAIADPNDKNKDGISGRANQVWDMQAKQMAMGRFGLKANQPNVHQQTAAAYVDDMGVTNFLFPEPDGTYDLDDEQLDLATFYTQSLSVPARTLLDDPVTQQGEKLFSQASCTACHIPTLRTGDDYPRLPLLASQTIHPYTDLLLHDMGKGLADNRPDFDATGQEWKTPALWGLGLSQTVLPYSTYLHDGRARSLEEAVLWHGGEAQASKEAFVAMDKGDRTALVRFLRSL